MKTQRARKTLISLLALALIVSNFGFLSLLPQTVFAEDSGEITTEQVEPNPAPVSDEPSEEVRNEVQSSAVDSEDAQEVNNPGKHADESVEDKAEEENTNSEALSEEDDVSTSTHTDTNPSHENGEVEADDEQKSTSDDDETQDEKLTKSDELAETEDESEKEAAGQSLDTPSKSESPSDDKDLSGSGAETADDVQLEGSEAEVGTQPLSDAPADAQEDESKKSDSKIEVIHFTRDGKEDVLRNGENYQLNKEGKPVYQDAEGNYYHDKPEDLEKFNKSLAYEENGTKYIAEYEFVFTPDGKPAYKITIKDAEGKEVETKTEAWTLDTKDTPKFTYEFKTQQGTVLTEHSPSLSYVNRLKDKDDEGTLLTEYYVGNGSGLNLKIQYVPEIEEQIKLKITFEGKIKLDKENAPRFAESQDYEIVQLNDNTYEVIFHKASATGAPQVIDLELPKLLGADGDTLDFTVSTEDATQPENYKRTFKLATTNYKDAHIRIDGTEFTDKQYADILDKIENVNNDPNLDPTEKAKKIAELKSKLPTVDAGQDDLNQIITEATARKVPVEIIFNKDDKWSNNPILRADSLAGKELDYLKVVIDLPEDNGKFAKYVHKSGLAFEEITKDDGKKQLVLELRKEDIKQSDLDAVNKIIGESKYEQAQSTDLANLLIEDKNDQVYIDSKGIAYVLDKKVLNHLGESGYYFKDGGNEVFTLNDNQEEVTVALINEEGKFVSDDEQKTPLNLKYDENGSLKFEKVQDGEQHKQLIKRDTQILSFEEKFAVGLGQVINVITGDNKEETAAPLVKFLNKTGENLRNIVIQRGEEKYYGGTIEGYEENGANENLVVKDQYGKELDFTATYNNEKWTFKPKDGDEKQIDLKDDKVSVVAADGLLIDFDRKILKDLGVNLDKLPGKIKADDGKTYHIVANDPDSKYYFDGQKFIHIDDKEASNIIGKEYYKGLVKTDLEREESYWTNPEKTWDENTKKYSKTVEGDAEKIYELNDGKREFSEGVEPVDFVAGPTDLSLYYVLSNKEEKGLYYSKSLNGDDLSFVKVRGEGEDLLSNQNVTAIRHVLHDSQGNKLDGKQPFVFDQGDINAIFRKSRKFDLDFSRFSSAKEHYDLNGRLQTQKKPEAETPDKGVFTFSTNFKLRSTKDVGNDFAKHAPSVLVDQQKPMDYEVFNLLYRSEKDTSRDAVIKRLLTKEDLSSKEQIFKAKLLEEIERFFPGAEFKWNEEKGRYDLQRTDENGDVETIDRSLDWRLTFHNQDRSEAGRMPFGTADAYVIDDFHLDKRLAYESLTFNLSRNAFKDAKVKAEKDGKDFKGDATLFYLDEIDEIYFGVNHLPQGYAFNLINGWSLKADDIRKLHENKKTEGTLKYGDKELAKYEISYNEQLAQVTINIRDIYLRAEEAQEGFYSPVQKAYEEERLRLVDEITKITVAEDASAEEKEKALENLKTVLAGENKVLLNCVDNSLIKADGAPMSFEEAKEMYLKHLQGEKDASGKQLSTGMQLVQTEGEKPYTNSIFNALRIKLKPGVSVPDKRYPAEQEKSVKINTVIKENVDIPYTDSYGNLLSNQVLVENLLQALKEDMKKKDSSLTDAKLEEQAQDKLKELVEKFEAKALAEGSKLNDEEGRTYYSDLPEKQKEELYHARKGSELEAKDTAVLKLVTKKDGSYDLKVEMLKDRHEQSLNPYYTLEGESYKKLEDDLGITSFREKELNLPAFYVHKDGYNHAFFVNSAASFISSQADGPKIYNNPGKSYHCPLGLYLCKPDEPGNAGGNQAILDDQDAKVHENKFKISVPEENTQPGPERPSFKKSQSGGSSTLLFENGESKDHIDFSISLKVDHLSLDQKKLEIYQGKGQLSDDDKQNLVKLYGGNKYRQIFNPVLIDVLPLGIDSSDMKIEVEIDALAMQANGANQNFNLEEYKKGVEILKINNFSAYLSELEKASAAEKDGEKAKLLKARLARLQAFAENYEKNFETKISDKQELVIVWLPDFEAPHGSGPQVTVKLKNVKADKHASFETKVNRSGFESEPYQGYDTETFTVDEKHDGNFHKYVRTLEEDQVGKWVKGTVEVKFGQDYDYKLQWTGDKAETFLTGSADKAGEFTIVDDFSQSQDNKFTPYLRGPVELRTEHRGDFDIVYKLKNGGEKTFAADKEITADDLDFKQVKSIELKVRDPQNAKFRSADRLELIIPMSTPEFKIHEEDEKIVADDESFNLAEYLKGSFLLAENTAKLNKTEETNKVNNKLTERVLQILKSWEDSKGQPLTGDKLKDLPAVEFTVQQISVRYSYKDGKWLSTGQNKEGQETEAGEWVKPEVKKYGESIKLNSKNSYQALLRDLPQTYKHIVYNVDGSINEEKSYILVYKYFIEEMPGYKAINQGISTEGEILTEEGTSPLNAADFRIKAGEELQQVAAEKSELFKLNFFDSKGKEVSEDIFREVQSLKNTLPDKPGTPPDEPEKPGTPPEEPEKPGEPGTPPEEPEKPGEPRLFMRKSRKMAKIYQPTPELKALVDKLPKTASAYETTVAVKVERKQRPAAYELQSLTYSEALRFAE